MIRNKTTTLVFVFVIFSLISACQAGWQVELRTQAGTAGEITPDLVAFYLDAPRNGETIPLAQVLYHHGFTLIDEISLYNGDGLIDTYTWEQIAEQATIDKSGRITIGDVVNRASTIVVTPSPIAAEIKLSIMDLSPTMAKVLGLPAMPDAVGQPQFEADAKHGVMILVDGLQYQKLQSLIAQGTLPFFENLLIIDQGLTVFPSITTASTAALLTGAPPQENGVYGYGMRSTEMKTLFDHAADHGLSVTAVEGHSLAFNLQNADVILSGDRDGDGHTDDNVLANSLEVIRMDMPDLLFIHFHDVDDQGHSFGPDSPEYEGAIIRVDAYLSEIIQALPPDTFIIIFADHGMQTDISSTGGNHGQLTESAMIIPIVFLEK